ncbi:SUKH-3 domain-containing protein [Hyalangium rubrum]|uniref:SUKH-3 domain-containing protein n=1 Tax=Hyalangium rubrum TaxID=3103134 RepID=A0ABU5GXX6_9BACT|nr:SUKH-3 domain-containing protein [Hyalangium sp. s54d21]MDY7226039.1 SUKH-3 domain-containing protein [Hyalangium sp. s54d21]
MKRLDEPLSPEVLASLRSAGWAPERSAPVEPARQALLQEGVVLHPVAEQVLQSLGGLSLRSGPERGARRLQVDAVEACRWIAEEDWPYIQKLFSPSACPVASGEGMLHFVSAEGRWLALHERWTVCYFLPDLDSMLRFAVFGGAVTFESRGLNGNEVPPGY